MISLLPWLLVLLMLSIPLSRWAQARRQRIRAERMLIAFRIYATADNAYWQELEQNPVSELCMHLRERKNILLAEYTALAEAV